MLSAIDDPSDSLTYSIAQAPSHGTLSGTPPNVTYTPAPEYSGPDSFTFKASDGALDSNVATVSITVSAVNDAPVANAQGVTTDEDVAASIAVSGSDAEGSPLTYEIASQPAHGTVGLVGTTATYMPAPNYNGPDSFTFKVKDGALYSSLATVSITVASVNDNPVAASDVATVARTAGRPCSTF